LELDDRINPYTVIEVRDDNICASMAITLWQDLPSRIWHND